MTGNPPAYTTTVSYTHSFNHQPSNKTTEESSEIRCICGFTHDDGFTIACDQCDTWQHGFCVDVTKEEVPDRYECPDCLPRALDVRKAIEHQLEYSKENEEKTRRKKPKSTASSNPSRGKGNSHSHYQNNHTSHLAPERAASSGKSTSKDSHHSRKRATQRASISVSNGITVDSSNASHVARVTPNPPSPTATILNDGNADADSDTDMERPTKVYRFDYTDITDGLDHYANREVQSHVASLANANDDTSICVKREQISARNLPRVPVHNVPDNSKAYSSLPQYYITVDTLCPQGDVVVICKGDISFQQSYKADTINQYSVLRHPKPCVFFHPTQPICIDSRIRGTVARFARRSCQPNTRLETIVTDSSEVVFALVAVEALTPKTPITVGWEWSGCPSMQRLANGAEPDELDHEEFQDALSWASILTEHMGECACQDKDDCVFSKLRVKRESLTPKPFPNNTRHNLGQTPGPSTPPGSSPDRQNSCEGDNSSSKSQSREISPTHEEPSSREARKIKEYISRIEKGDQPVVPKRRKRNNTVGANSATAALKSTTKTENGRRSKATISPPPTVPVEMDQPIESVSRGPSETSTNMEEQVQGPASPNGSTQMQPPPAPALKRVKRAAYVDSCMQTDECEGAWWINPPQDIPPRPCPLSLKERLLQSMMREKARAAKEESKKRKQNEMVDGGCSPIEPCKGLKMTKDSDVKTITPNSSLSTTCADVQSEMQSAEVPSFQQSESLPASSQSPANSPPADNSNIGLQSNGRHPSPPSTDLRSLSPPPSSHLRGPALADIFADSSPQHIAESVPDQKRTPPVSPGSMDSNSGPITTPPPSSTGRNFGLQVQLPSGPSFPTAPTTPSPVPASATSPPPQTPGPQPTSPLTASANSLAFHQSNQGSNFPTAKTKKLSLSEYNRRKRVDTANDFKDRKAMHALSEEPPNMGPNDVPSP